METPNSNISPAAPASDPDREFAAALDAALGGGSGVVLEDRPKVNRQGGWADGRERHFSVQKYAHPGYNDDGKYNLQNISNTHEALITFLIANPQAKLRDVAAEFGYSQAWLSSLMRSDLFQARLRERQDEVFAGVAQEITEKLKSVADIGLEKLATQLEMSEDPRFIMESTKLALTNLGFGSKTGPVAGTVNAQNVQQNFYVASAADLEAARGRIMGSGGPGSPSQMPGPAQSEATLTETSSAEGRAEESETPALPYAGPAV